ncbi:MAG: hypothetical protein Q4E89_02700 [Eubacteriales bacterium]|nr:hypothetical protein [Eubacteriales bacterium]
MRRKMKLILTFSFSATNEELKGNVINVPMDQTVTLQDGTKIRFKNLTLTKLDSRIEAELEKAAGSEEDIQMECYLNGEDSLGNPIWYVCDSMDGKNVEFVSDLQKGLPSVDSEWLEFQFYFYERADKKDQQPIDIVDGEEIVMEEDGVPMNRVDVGDPFRVMIDQDMIGQNDTSVGNRPAQVTSEQIRKLTPDMTREEILEFLGDTQDIGSGMHVYVHEVDQEYQVKISFTGDDALLGVTGSDLLKRREDDKD